MQYGALVMNRALQVAFENVPRSNFLPEDVADRADNDVPLPIGFGQTNSQPTTVAMMLSWLNPEPGNKILDVGSGSGWTSALLAHLVGQKGKVYSVEIIPDLVKFGRDNCRRLGIKNVKFFEAGDNVGLPKHAPYDRILVSASAQELPRQLLDQLKTGGKMVIPIVNDIYEIYKKSDGLYDTNIHPRFSFVLLVIQPDKNKLLQG